MRSIFLFVFSIIVLNGYPQEEIITYSEATPLSESINSDQDELLPLVSSDGENIYFVRDSHNKTDEGYIIGQNIFHSKKNGDDWETSSEPKGNFNNKSNNAVVGISKDENTLYLVNAYQQENGSSRGIAVSHLKGDKWSNPEYIEITGLTFENDHYYGFYVNPEENAMLISMASTNGKGMEDLYLSLKEGNVWTQPRALSPNVNSEGFEISPYLSSGNQRIYYSSNGFGGSGDADIFYIDRLGEDWFSWSDPVNLGPSVNSSGFDAFFSLGIDEKAYFVSNRNGQNDIYTTQITIEDPFVEVVEETPEPIDEPELTEEEVSEKFGDQTAPNLVFKVQIAAYTNAKNYDSKHLESLGSIEKIVLDDGITRFTIGSFDTLKAAENLQSEAKSKGQQDAFVIIFVDGKRTYIEKLIESGVFK